MSGGVDWAALLRLGIGRLGLAPDAFWALTPFEFAIIAGPSAAPAVDAAALRALMALDPDDAPAAAREAER